MTIFAIIAYYQGNTAHCLQQYVYEIVPASIAKVTGATRPVTKNYNCGMYIEKCNSGEIVDIVLSNVARKYAILAGYKIVMNQCSACMRFIKP